MTIRPGRPFWSGFTAFAANMVAILSLETLSITVADVRATWPGAIIASLFVAAAVYGKAKIDEALPEGGADGGS